MISSLESGSESSEGKFELKEHIETMCKSLEEINFSTESLAKMDRNYQEKINRDLGDIVHFDRSIEGRYKTFDEIHEDIHNLQRELGIGLSRAVSGHTSRLEIEDSDIRKLLGNVTKENSEDIVTELKQIREKLSDFCEYTEKDREEKRNGRNTVRLNADKTAYNWFVGKAKNEETNRFILDERITTVARKYNDKLGNLRGTVSELNLRANDYEEAGLEVIKERYRNFSRAVGAVLSQLDQSKG